MLFNSLAFLAFFPAVLAIYFSLPVRLRNVGLLLASYFFYGCWDWRFLGLLALSTVVDFYCARWMDASDSPKYRKRLLWVSLSVNLGLLGIFKYFNFFAENFVSLLQALEFDVNLRLIKVLLPVGISFYTFQTLSYTIDVYRRQLKPTDSILDFAVYVSYFPQLVAGPIERASNLLPQLSQDRPFHREQFVDGIGLIATGFFKKIVIADRCALLANTAFTSEAMPYPGMQNWLFLYAFAFQIYGDFSGYSDIARGVSKMFGVELMLNFGKPFLTTNPAEFWRHWHISLSTWLRDYLYIPLGGNRGGPAKMYRNLMVTMLLGGIWHGAGWAFVIWGIYQGVLLIGHRLLRGAIPNPKQRLVALLVNSCKLFVFFHLVCIGWLLFRCGALTPEQNAISFILTSLRSLVAFQFAQTEFGVVRTVLLMGILTFLLQWNYARFEVFHQWPDWKKTAWLVAVMVAITVLGVFDGAQFIYFQF